MNETRIKDLEEFLVDAVWQFGHRSVKDGKPVIHSGGLSTLEFGFRLLGWDDPHFLTDEEQDGTVCEIDGCVRPASAGWKWDGLYLRICSDHLMMERGGKPRPSVKQYAKDREATRDPKTGTLPHFTT